MDAFIDSSVSNVGLQVDVSLLKTHLDNLGVEQPTDVNMLTKSDLSSLMKVVQARKLIAYWKPVKDTNDG